MYIFVIVGDVAEDEHAKNPFYNPLSLIKNRTKLECEYVL